MRAKNLRPEIIGGITTFFTMAYIVIVNPAILSAPGTGMAFSGVLTATVMLCFTMTLLMGLYAKLPYAVAPGMGINAFFTYSILLGAKVPWPIALGIVFWAGVLFLLASITPLRVWITEAIPHSLRIASASGIGIFISFIGLKNLGLVIGDPQTFVTFGKITPKIGIGLIELGIIAILFRRKNPFAFLVGILFATLASLALGWTKLPSLPFSAPDFHSVFFKLDPLGALKLSLLPTVLGIFFTDLFDSISTFVGVSQATGLLESKGQPKRLREGLIVDAWATLTAGLFGTSSGTAYIESATGIEAGARTGTASVITALCFLPCFFVAPLVAMVPDVATAPVLIFIGALMFRGIRGIPTEKLEESLPAFLTLILTPLTFSITQGLLWGFISFVGLHVVAGRGREIKPMLYGIALLSLALVFLRNSN